MPEKYVEKKEIYVVRNRMEANEKYMSDNRKMIDRINKQMKNIRTEAKKSRPGMPGGPDGVNIDGDLDDMEQAQADIVKLQADTKHIQEVFKRNLDKLNELMPTKAETQEMIDFEARLNQRLNDVLKRVLDLMPSKEELSKKFNVVWKKHRHLENMMQGDF